jgi:hypothetical protein
LNSLGVQVEREVELTRFVGDEDAVTAFLRRPDGSEETPDVDWMIGCDGAHSAVRHGLGMEFEGETLPSNWVLADIHLAGVPAPPDEMEIYWNAAGPLLLLPITNGRYRIIADVTQAEAGAHPGEPTLEEVQALALVCRGFANPEPLLESYSAERTETGRQVVTAADRLTTIAVLKSGLAQGIRNHLASLLFGLSPVRRAMNAMSELSIGYPHGPLTIAEAHSHSGPAAGERAPLSAAGHRVGSGDRPRFAIFGETDGGSAGLIARHADLLEAETRAPFADDGIWLVRPDGYVAMTVRRGEWEKVGAYLDWIASG